MSTASCLGILNSLLKIFRQLSSHAQIDCDLVLVYPTTRLVPPLFYYIIFKFKITHFINYCFLASDASSAAWSQKMPDVLNSKA